MASGGSLHSYVAQQIGTMKNKTFMEDTDVRTSILRHAEEVNLQFFVFFSFYMFFSFKIFWRGSMIPEAYIKEAL